MGKVWYGFWLERGGALVVWVLLKGRGYPEGRGDTLEAKRGGGPTWWYLGAHLCMNLTRWSIMEPQSLCMEPWTFDTGRGGCVTDEKVHFRHVDPSPPQSFWLARLRDRLFRHVDPRLARLDLR
jgi:hypothetical protein